MFHHQKNIIPEQFTVKAHPALFEGEGGGGGAKKSEEHFSQQTNQYYFTAKLPANQAILFHWRLLKTAQSAV